MAWHHPGPAAFGPAPPRGYRAAPTEATAECHLWGRKVALPCPAAPTCVQRASLLHKLARTQSKPRHPGKRDGGAPVECDVGSPKCISLCRPNRCSARGRPGRSRDDRTNPGSEAAGESMQHVQSVHNVLLLFHPKDDVRLSVSDGKADLDAPSAPGFPAIIHRSASRRHPGRRVSFRAEPPTAGTAHP